MAGVDENWRDKEESLEVAVVEAVAEEARARNENAILCMGMGERFYCRAAQRVMRY